MKKKHRPRITKVVFLGCEPYLPELARLQATGKPIQIVDLVEDADLCLVRFPAENPPEHIPWMALVDNPSEEDSVQLAVLAIFSGAAWVFTTPVVPSQIGNLLSRLY